MAYILAGVGTASLYNKADGSLILTSKTLTDSGISVGLSSEEIRGGNAAALLGRYFHSSNFAMNLVDATFDLNYLALNVGGDVIVGGDAFTIETVEVQNANQITVLGTPQDWLALGYKGWARKAGTDNWEDITFEGKTASLIGAEVGDTYCVKYVAHFDNMSYFEVPTNMIPSECIAVIDANLYAADSGGSISSKVAELQIEIPRFQLDGAQDFSMNMTGAATSNIAGVALAVDTTGASCENTGIYARIKQINLTGAWYDGLKAMAVDGAESTMAKSSQKTIKVIGIYDGGRTGVIRNENLTFNATGGTGITVSQAGVVSTSGSATGTATIDITVTEKPTVSAIATVTVSA